MGTMYDHAARIHAATVAIHEAVEDQLSSSSEVSAIVALDIVDAAADALAAELAEARELANAYSAALSMVEDCLADAAGDDTSINDIRQSLGLPARDDMLPAPGDTNN